MVRSPDGDTTFFEITTGLLQGVTLALFLFMVCLDYILKTYIDNSALNTDLKKIQMISIFTYNIH